MVDPLRGADNVQALLDLIALEVISLKPQCISSQREAAGVQLVRDLIKANVISLEKERITTLMDTDRDPSGEKWEDILTRRYQVLLRIAEEHSLMPSSSSSDSDSRPEPISDDKHESEVKSPEMPAHITRRFTPDAENSTADIDSSAPQEYSLSDSNDGESEIELDHEIEVKSSALRDQGGDKGTHPRLYEKGRDVYSHLDNTDVNKAQAKAPTEPDLSRSFFSELSQQDTGKEKRIPGSFPSIKDFESEPVLFSKGYFGKVFKSKWKGMPVVLKVSKERNEEANRADFHEFSVNIRLKPHRNVLQITGLCPKFRYRKERLGTTAIVSPMQENGGLRKFFDERLVQPNDHLEVAIGMILGIRSLHQQRAVHRDIAVRNFLVNRFGRVLLCDFGLAIFLPEDEDEYHCNLADVKLPWKYMAPESFEGIFSTKSDIWMYGVSLFELFSGGMHLWHNYPNPKLLRGVLQSKLRRIQIEKCIRESTFLIRTKTTRNRFGKQIVQTVVSERIVGLIASFTCEDEVLKLPNMNAFPQDIVTIIRHCCQIDPDRRPSAEQITTGIVILHSGKTSFSMDKHLQVEQGLQDIDKTRGLGDNDVLNSLQGLEDADETRGAAHDEYVSFNYTDEAHYYLAVEPETSLGFPVEPSDLRFSPPDLTKISESVFPELFRTREVTRKKIIHKSFPHIDEFEGGIHLLGSGSFGYTFKSVFRGAPVVLKVSKMQSEEANRADYHEWSVSEKLQSHPNVLQIVGLCPSFHSPLFGNNLGTTALITPLQENGGLREFFDQRVIRDNDIIDIAFGMIAGVRSLHEQRVVHRDIAVRNFLVDCDGRVLLCDFGITKFLPKGQEQLRGDPYEALPWRYLAPESFDRVFSRKSDIWMYGLTLVELVSQKEPFGDIRRFKDLREAFKKKELNLPNLEDLLPPVLEKIVRECLQFDPSDRPSAADIAERLVRAQFAKFDLDRDVNGNTALHREVLKNDHRGVQKLLESSEAIMINAENNVGETALMLAKSEEIRISLLSHRKVPQWSTEPTRNAEYSRNVDIFGTFMKLAKVEDLDTIKSLALSLQKITNDSFGRIEDSEAQTPLHIAAATGNTALFDALLALNLFAADKTDESGQTALHVASLHGHASIAKALIELDRYLEVNDNEDSEEKGKPPSACSVNCKDNMGKTALHLAVANGCISVVKVLLSNDSVDVNLRDKKGRSPIFDSVSSANDKRDPYFDVLRLLLTHKSVDLGAKDSSGETVWHLVARNDLAEAANILLEFSELTDFDSDWERTFTPLHVALGNRSFGVVNVFLSRDNINMHTPDKLGNTLLHKLAGVLTQSTGPRRDITPLKLEEVTRIATLLVSHNAVNVNTSNLRGDTPLHIAARADNVFVGSVLLSSVDTRVNVQNEKGETPLHEAASYNGTNIASLLLSSENIKPDACTQSMQTPLHYAARSNSVGIAEMLLSRSDVDADARDDAWQMPLHYAARSNSVKIAEMLLSRGDVHPDPLDDAQQSPLHIAACCNSVEVFEMLASMCEDVALNARDECGRTPLHYAVLGNCVQIARLLLSRSEVLTDVRDDDGDSALYLAAHNFHPEILEVFLEKYGLGVI